MYVRLYACQRCHEIKLVKMIKMAQGSCIQYSVCSSGLTLACWRSSCSCICSCCSWLGVPGCAPRRTPDSCDSSSAMGSTTASRDDGDSDAIPPLVLNDMHTAHTHAFSYILHTPTVCVCVYENIEIGMPLRFGRNSDKFTSTNPQCSRLNLVRILSF